MQREEILVLKKKFFWKKCKGEKERKKGRSEEQKGRKIRRNVLLSKDQPDFLLTFAILARMKKGRIEMLMGRREGGKKGYTKEGKEGREKVGRKEGRKGGRKK